MYRVAQESIGRARAGGGPAVIEGVRFPRAATMPWQAAPPPTDRAARGNGSLGAWRRAKVPRPAAAVTPANERRNAGAGYTDNSNPLLPQRFRVHLRFLVPVVGLAVFTVSSGLAQTPVDAQAALPPDAPTQQQSTPAAPVPAPLNPADVPSRPAYSTTPGETQAAPVPETSTPSASVQRHASLAAQTPAAKDVKPRTPPLGSTYIPVDSWIYPAMTRLQGLGLRQHHVPDDAPVDSPKRAQHAGRVGR